MDSALQYFKEVDLGIDRNTFLKLTTISIVSVTGIYLGKIWLSYRYFDEIGVKTPSFKYLFGHLGQLMQNKNDSAQCQKWTQEYGKTYGLVNTLNLIIHNIIQKFHITFYLSIYEGHIPFLVTTDLDIIQEVFIKQFNNFSARKVRPKNSRLTSFHEINMTS